MARHKNIVTGAFYGSNDYESYVIHFDLLLEPQKVAKKTRQTAPEPKLITGHIILRQDHKNWLLIFIAHF